MLTLADSWVWDSWYVDDGERFHCFFLKASRGLGDPERRHYWPVVGHAISTDLTSWTIVADAIAPQDPGAFDDQAIWTGSVVRGDDARWHMFFTGICRDTLINRQGIGHAVSDDLHTWERVSHEPAVVADSRWYATFAGGHRENWRDPWVMREGSGWRMLVTASSKGGEAGRDGCIATAVSPDLSSWVVQAPVAANVGLGQLEVPQIVEHKGRYVLVFCMSASDVQVEGLPRVTGTWTAPADSPTGPFHIDRAEPINVEGNYAGRLVLGRDGRWNLMAFVDRGGDGEFIGCIGNPVPLELTDRGTMQPTSPHDARIFREVN